MGKQLVLAVACVWVMACGDASKFAGQDGAARRDAVVEVGGAVDIGVQPDLSVDHLAMDGKPVTDGAMVIGPDAARPVDAPLEAFDPLGGCAGNFVACGCGCCGPSPGSGAEIRCYYPSEGDRLSSIMADDLAARGAPSCSYVGCSLGILYQCCAPTGPATPATYSVETLVGGADRLILRRVGTDGVCASLVLVTPASAPNPAFRVTAPTGFQVEDGEYGDCGSADRTLVVGGVGAVTLRKIGATCTLDAQLSLFLPTPAGTAASIRFETTGLIVNEASQIRCPQ